MPNEVIKKIIPASVFEVFDLIHNYRRRLEWDTLLQEAYLEPEFSEAGKGAISVCRGRRILGGFAVRTIYITFERGKIAAVKMLNSPPFFESFAASIRHYKISDESSEVVYHYNFTAKPGVLRPVLHPLMSRILKWETEKRLEALKNHFMNQKDKLK